MPSKDRDEVLREEARKGNIRRPRRTRCEACRTEYGTPLLLLHHIKTRHRS